MSRSPYVALHVSSGSRRATAADIVESVRREIAGGAFPAGSRLPPVRALERQLGLSKNTAQAAYDELVARGLVEAREREGVFVLATTAIAAAPPIASPPLPALVPPPLSRPDFAGRGTTALSTVFIDPDLLPTERIAECARSVLREKMPSQYEAQGYRPLREVIAKRLAARGLDVSADEVVITTGSQQSLDIVARSLQHKRIALESPVYAYAKLLFESLGHELVGLPIDPFASRAIDLDAWDRALATRPSLAYLITSFHNPTGYSYNQRRAARVLELCTKPGVAVLEDDWCSDMACRTASTADACDARAASRLRYLTSFTRICFPRCGSGSSPPAPKLVPTLVAMKRLSTLATRG